LCCAAALIPPLRTPVLYVARAPLSLLMFSADQAHALVYFPLINYERRALQRDNDLLRRRLAEYAEIEQENGRLRALLEFKQQSDRRLAAAQVIGTSVDNWTSLVIINKGSSAGISRGDVAMSFKGLVGRVVQVTGSTAKVLLANDPRCAVSALCQRSRQEGLVTGTLSGTLLMKYLPKDADIVAGDTIVTSGLTELFPKGILIGTVSSVGEEFGGLSRYAVVTPAVEFRRLEEVLIILR
jgi:rod shape-determining protein MreC